MTLCHSVKNNRNFAQQLTEPHFQTQLWRR